MDWGPAAHSTQTLCEDKHDGFEPLNTIDTRDCILETAGAVCAGDCTTAAASGAVRAGDSAIATEVSLAMYAFSKVDMSVKGMPNTGGDFEGRHKPGYHQDFRSKRELRPCCKHVCKLINMWWTCQSRADTYQW